MRVHIIHIICRRGEGGGGVLIYYCEFSLVHSGGHSTVAVRVAV